MANSAVIIDGKAVSQQTREKIAVETKELKEKTGLPQDWR